MPRPPQAEALAAARRRRVEADQTLARAIADTEQARRLRDRAVLTPGADREAADASLQRARRTYDSVRAERNRLLAEITRLSTAAANAANDAASAALFEGLEGDVPIALLPVRLETRYQRGQQGVAALRIRVYPDDLHVQRHTDQLTAAEQQAGRAYWEARFAAAKPASDAESADDRALREQRPKALWGELVKTLRAPRAAFVVERLRPTNLAAAATPGSEPAFPDVGDPGSRLAAQPIATMLPDRFCAIGYAKGSIVFRRFGQPVPDVLAAAPVLHPGDRPPVEEAPGAFDGEAAWIARYDEAVAKGMGITVTAADVAAWRQANPNTPAWTLAEPLDRLVVVGVDWTLTPTEAADGLAGLLEGHAAAGGMSFVPIGTPTNNTGGRSAGASDAQARDPQTPEPAPPPADTTAVAGLRVALGLSGDALSSTPLPHETRDDPELSRHMLNALYRALCGQFLESEWVDRHDATLGERSRQLDALDALRDHVVRFLRPAGPIQPIRVGMQPYGILPVVARWRWQPADGTEEGLSRVLGVLRPAWDDAVSKVARFDGTDTGTHRLLLHGPWAQTASYRPVEKEPVEGAVQDQVFAVQLEQLFSQHGLFAHLIGATWGAAHQNVVQLAAFEVSTLALAPEPNRLPAAMPWVQADAQRPGKEAPADATLQPNYVQTLANAVVARGNTKSQCASMRQSGSLLQGLLAYSLHLEADATSVRIVEPVVRALDGRSITVLPSIPRAVGIEPIGDRGLDVSTIAHVGELAHYRMPAVTGAETIGDYVAREADALVRVAAAEGSSLQASWFARPSFDRSRLTTNLRVVSFLGSVKESLQQLAPRTVGELDWALRTTLDVFDWRLDAWYTSLATRRLSTLRLREASTGFDPALDRQRGVHVGAWGYVDGLVPDAPLARESRGHVLTPSLRHAAAAAMLRSGYESNGPAERKTFALDLASHRVRAARDVLEGLAQGQPLAALLGYRFERGLRDAGLAQYLLDYRAEFPLRPPVTVSGVLVGFDQPAEESIAARNVTNGVALLDRLTDAFAIPTTAEHRVAVARIVQELQQLWDAVSDVAVSEGVFQIAQGNMERAAAALATLDKQGAPVEPQSVLSPRDGVRYTQRVAVVLDDATALPFDWPTDAMAAAEPRANRLVADLLGDPARYALTASVLTSDGEIVPLELDARAIGLSPIALLMALDAPGAVRADARMGQPAAEPPEGLRPVRPAEEPGEFGQLRLRLVEALTRAAREAGVRRGGRLHVDERPLDRDPRDRRPGLVHLEAMLGLARRLLQQGRPAYRSDLTVVEGRFDATATDGDYPGVDAVELDARAVAARDALVAARTAVDAALASDDDATIEAAVRAARLYGLPGTEDDRPGATPEQAAALLRDRARAAQAQLVAREAAVAARRADLPPAPTVAQLAPVAIETLRAVFGRAFPVLPLFTFGDAAPAVQACLDAQPTLTAGKAAVVPGWLPQLARVRPGVDHLQAMLTARESIAGRYATDRFAVLQSTGRTGGTGQVAPWEQPWAALPEAWPERDAATEGDLLNASHRCPDLAVAMLAPFGVPAAVQADTRLCGLVCDDWSETVPFHTVTAGIAFHYDAPGARAPQAVLLAVPPRANMASWTFEDVRLTIEEAIALSRLRLVRPWQLEGSVNLALPMNLIPDLPVSDVPGLDFKHLATTAFTELAKAGVGSVWAQGKV